jgi:hypothetical protein
MKKKVIAFMAVVLFLSAISYSEEKAPTGTDYSEIIGQKNEEIAKLEAELVEKAKLIQQKDEEINKWKVMCIAMNSKEKVVPKQLEEIKIIDKPFYGVRLGEDITELAKRCPVEFAQEMGIWKTYRVKSERELLVTTVADKISSISVFPADRSVSNYNALVEGVKTEYPDVKEGPTTVDRAHNFVVFIDHQEVGINVMHKQRSTENILLTISYIYPKLADSVVKVEGEK